VTIIVLLLAVVLGVSIGLRSRDGSSSNDPSNSSDMAPIAIDPNITIRAAVLTSYINNITLTNKFIAANGTSPESQALSWLIYNDTFLETAAVISEDDPISKNAIGFRIRQRYALLTMWFQQKDTAKWAITTGWLVDPAECAWYGISCQTSYVYYYNKDDTYGGSQNAVTQVMFNLLGSYIGVIPYDVGLLTTMEHFEIQNTQDSNIANGKYLLGSLPDSIGQWTALTYFDVSGNALNGTLPDSLGQWTGLTYFDVSLNYGLDGTLPDSIGQWAALTYFDVSLNYGLTGALPDIIGQWTALTFFSVFDNALNGTLPDSIGQWTALTYFDVSVNYGLTGTLPSSIGQWAALTYFDISSNYGLNGTLPDSIGQWTALANFDVSFNSLNGTIPSSIGNWSLIFDADFSWNPFLGTMPNAICQYIDPDSLSVDCTVNCTCCTSCS
jgi:hypothetical protein